MQERRKKKRNDNETNDNHHNRNHNKHEKYHHQEQEDKEEDKEEYISNHERKSNLRTVFIKESKEELEKRKKRAQEPLEKRNKPLSMDTYKTIPYPKRPTWTSESSTEEVEKIEENYFNEYLNDIKKNYSNLNNFEHNIEVWRQLWRVMERSDFLLVVTDIRHPLFHFPKSLYEAIVETKTKQMVLVLNKCDLISEEQQKAWKTYFQKEYPEIVVVFFTSFKPIKKKSQKQGKRKKPDLVRLQELWKACQDVCQQMLDDPKHRIHHYPQMKKKYTKGIDYFEDMIERTKERMHSDDDEHRRVSNKITPAEEFITLGLVGHPNVGKSCLLNAMVGKNVVSSSYTPGHTKHFQTFYVSPHVQLCDSPGLVFPAENMPKALQVLCGIFPIAQVREPYTAIQFVAERLPLEDIIDITIPEYETEWSAWNMAYAWAEKRKYMVKGRANPFRAANELLRFILRGSILLSFAPPGMENSWYAMYPSQNDEENDDDDEDLSESTSSSDELVMLTQPKKKKKKKKKKNNMNTMITPAPQHSGFELLLDE